MSKSQDVQAEHLPIGPNPEYQTVSSGDISLYFGEHRLSRCRDEEGRVFVSIAVSKAKRQQPVVEALDTSALRAIRAWLDDQIEVIERVPIVTVERLRPRDQAPADKALDTRDRRPVPL